MEQVGANPGGADGECELNTPEEMEMDKEQKVWRKAWKKRVVRVTLRTVVYLG